MSSSLRDGIKSKKKKSQTKQVAWALNRFNRHRFFFDFNVEISVFCIVRYLHTKQKVTSKKWKNERDHALVINIQLTFTNIIIYCFLFHFLSCLRLALGPKKKMKKKKVLKTESMSRQYCLWMRVRLNVNLFKWSAGTLF